MKMRPNFERVETNSVHCIRLKTFSMHRVFQNYHKSIIILVTMVTNCKDQWMGEQEST